MRSRSFLFLLVSIVCLGFSDFAQVRADSVHSSQVIPLDGSDWLLATDPDNAGRDQQWYNQPQPQAKQVKVPWIIQVTFPEYHGVAWYWKEFNVPVNASEQGRYILRFWAVDYKADVWVNGKEVGSHENGETPFELDVTDAVKTGKNFLAVRVLNPSHQPIDGIVLNESPHRNKVMPYSAGGSYNHGGIVDSVELLVVPAVRIADVFAQPDMHTGKIKVQTTLRNAGEKTVEAKLSFAVSPAAGGETITIEYQKKKVAAGDTVLTQELTVQNPRLWKLNDPFLYRVTVNAEVDKYDSLDEYAVKCGFREFVFKDGYFRLNGKRVYLKCSHTGNHCPIGQQWAHDPDLFRRDLLNCKVMGFNSIRFIAGLSTRYQLELADEIGLMVYTEPYAAWCLADSPQMTERYDRAIREMILRDRNHASIVMWGMLNETVDGPVFRHAVKTLELVRSLDTTRLVLLNSGRWDNAQGPAGTMPAGLKGWRMDSVDPCVTFNATECPIDHSNVLWEPKRLAFHPGQTGEYSTVRWIAPTSEDYEITARFIDISRQAATTDVHVLQNGQALFEGFINLEGQGKEQVYSAKLPINKNDKLDFCLGFGNGHYGGDSTGLEVVIKAANGKIYDAAGDFSDQENSGGPWSYGMLSAGTKPASASFQVYNSRFSDPVPGIGSLSNPGSLVWEDVLDDQHPYRRAPHTADIINFFRTVSPHKPYFLSEYGIGSGVNWMRVVRLFEQNGYPLAEDGLFYKARRDQFLADYEKWNLAEAFGRPEEFFIQSIAKMAGQRTVGINAIRANPSIVAHSVTGTVDQGMSGEGLTTTFRELKPGTVDALFDLWSPLRWCTFAEPVNLYRGGKVKLEAVLSNEDVLRPGDYPAHVWVFGPNREKVFDRSFTVTVPDPKTAGEQPFAKVVFSEEVPMDVPTGCYSFEVSFEAGAAATGGQQTRFYVFDTSDIPAVPQEVVLWGEDAELAQWLTDHGIKVRPFDASITGRRELILASHTPAAPGGAEAFRDLAARIAQGSSVVFLSPGVFKNGDNTTAFAPLPDKGAIRGLSHWLYHVDEWAKKHPIFAGMQSGALMDYTYYREIIPDLAWTGGSVPAEAVAGMNDVSWFYDAGLTVAVHKLGAGQFVLNTLLIRENLGRIPQAEKLLRNMLNYAGQDIDKPAEPLPADFAALLQQMGY